jgi:hypothetical protein
MMCFNFAGFGLIYLAVLLIRLQDPFEQQWTFKAYPVLLRPRHRPDNT